MKWVRSAAALAVLLWLLYINQGNYLQLFATKMILNDYVKHLLICLFPAFYLI